MHYITDYQLDINRGFQCKVNGKCFDIRICQSSDEKRWFLSHQFEKLLIELKLDPDSVVKSYGIFATNHLLYCDSIQKCYDLCQNIVDRYFVPNPFTKNDEEFTIEIYGKKHTFFLTKNVMFYWDSKTIASYHFNDHISLTEVGNICYILKINKQKQHNGIIGFETKEDAIKFAKYVIQYHYPRKETKECSEKSREHLNSYYHGTEQVNFPNATFILKQFRAREYFWSGTNPNIGSKDIYGQFELSPDQTLKICNNLKLHAYFCTNTLLFGSREDAIKFTDYLIETYIIKKEKTYDTNQLRKERTAISRGAKPTGSIIHGRRSKAAVRCRHLEHKARIGN